MVHWCDVSIDCPAGPEREADAVDTSALCPEKRARYPVDPDSFALIGLCNSEDLAPQRVEKLYIDPRLELRKCGKLLFCNIYYLRHKCCLMFVTRPCLDFG